MRRQALEFKRLNDGISSNAERISDSSIDVVGGVDDNSSLQAPGKVGVVPEVATVSPAEQVVLYAWSCSFRCFFKKIV